MEGRGNDSGRDTWFQGLVESSQELFWQCDAEGRYTYLNPAWEVTLGYRVEEMLGKHFSAFQTPDQAERDREQFPRLVDGGRVTRYETVHRHRLGHPVHLVFSARARVDEAGRIVGTGGTARDATESKHLEAALRQSEAGYRRMFDDMPLAFCTADTRYRFLDANAAFQRLFGYSAEELRGMTFRDLTETDQVSRDQDELERLARQEMPAYRTLKRYRDRGGRRIWGLATVSAVRDERGEVINFLAGVADITEVKEGEELLAEAQRIAEVGSFDYDIASGFWASSRKLDEIFGIDAAYRRDVPGWLALVHDHDRDTMARYLAERVVGRREPFDKQYRLKRVRQGQAVWVHGRGKLSLDENNQPVRLFGTIQDISAAKQAEQSLRASEQKYRTLVDSLNVGVFHSSLDGRLLHTNLAAAQMAGYSSVEEFLATSAAQLYANQDERQQLIQALQRDGAVRGREMASLRRDGTVYPLEISAVLLRDGEGRPESLLGVVADISERKLGEELVQRTQHLESLGVLAGGIAHDFNNLLTGVFGFLDVAEFTSQEPEVKDLLRQAGEALTRARALTQQLLTFAKGGKPKRRVAPVDGVIRSAARFALAGTRIRGEFDLAADLWSVNHDEHQIAQVIDNLIINAVQAMPLGGTLTMSAANVGVSGHPTLADGDYVRIAFKDQGIGIPKELLPRIFDPYFTTKQTGSGLGLATTFSIVRRHDGTIEVESEPGVGSTFHVYLPAATAADASSPEAAVAAFRGSGTVLVMDDEEMIPVVLGTMLEHLGFRCEAARDAAGLLALYERLQAGGTTAVCAILDLTIAGGPGGIEALSQLRGCGAQFPIFAMSGYSDDPVISEPGSFGFAGSLAKPFTVAAVAQLLASLGASRPTN